ncbi:hypothetical protein FRC07_005232, partial [Ceratobasidium sp. 392]
WANSADTTPANATTFKGTDEWSLTNGRVERDPYKENGTAPLDRDVRRSRSRSPARESSRGDTNPGTNLHVSGLHLRVTDQVLEDTFSKYGKVEKAQVVYDPHTRDSRGFAFVMMSTLEEAEAAISGLNGYVLEGMALRVDKNRLGGAELVLQPPGGTRDLLRETMMSVRMPHVNMITAIAAGTTIASSDALPFMTPSNADTTGVGTTVDTTEVTIENTIETTTADIETGTATVMETVMETAMTAMARALDTTRDTRMTGADTTTTTTTEAGTGDDTTIPGDRSDRPHDTTHRVNTSCGGWGGLGFRLALPAHGSSASRFLYLHLSESTSSSHQVPALFRSHDLSRPLNRAERRGSAPAALDVLRQKLAGQHRRSRAAPIIIANSLLSKLDFTEK